mmetsp:Transcript_52802/g.98900  ORF Transcript_52802/g.98900 Transcript_52802/m.98900 type:complete len:282 (-) Transcript_52802:145-990(-)
MTAHVVPMLDWPCVGPVLVMQPAVLQPVPVPLVGVAALSVQPQWNFLPDLGSSLKQAMQTMPADFQHSAEYPSQRVLCYGDSLTAGFFAGGHKFDPYGRTMSEAFASSGLACQVTVCGHSGATTREMLEAAESHLVDVLGCRGDGLHQILDRREYDLVILMSGTNDMGSGRDLAVIVEDLLQLHAVCHSRGVATVAVAPPPAPQFLPEQEAKRQYLVEELRHFSTQSSFVRAFVDPADILPPVPGPFWDPDGLHFAPAGSQALGLSLANLVLHLTEEDRSS